MIVMDREQLSPLARFIIDRRRELRLSQDGLAKRAGIPRGTIAAVEAGLVAEVKASNLELLAKGLGVPYATLDRVNRGLAPEADATDKALATMLSEASPDVKRIFWEILTMPDDKRAAAEAGLMALAAALRQQSEPR